jgi:hypothetical protein
MQKVFIEDQSSFRSYNSAPRPPHPPLSRQQVISLYQSSCVSPVQLTDGRGGGRGGGRSQIIQSRGSLALYQIIQLSLFACLQLNVTKLKRVVFCTRHFKLAIIYRSFKYRGNSKSKNLSIFTSHQPLLLNLLFKN